MFAANAFDVSAKEIENLSEGELVALANRLIWDEGQRLRIPPNDIRITLRIHDPDGGADAITDAGERQGRFMELGMTVWQFKARWPKRVQRLENELRRGAVAQEGFRQGAGYTLILGQGMTPGWQLKRERVLRELLPKVGCNGSVRLLVADHVAGWASSVPAALFELRPQIREFYRADQFLQRNGRHAIEFQPDEARASIATSIQELLFGVEPTAMHTRVQGQAGVGKTRLALEVVKQLGLDSLTLYSPDVPSRELFGWVAANDYVNAIVIVDECDEAEALRLDTLTRQCHGRLRLITVGVGSGSGPSTYTLGTLDVPAMERIVRATATALPPEQVKWIAEKTQGYVKLAVAVALAIARGVINIAHMHSDAEIRGVISRLLSPDPENKRALAGVSLLTRVGWRDDVANDGQAIAKFIAMDWNRMQLALAPAMQDGLVVRKGRYWYVSPELLALWLAAEVWQTQSHRVAELLNSLPTQESRDALLERLSRLGDVPSVGGVLEELVGENGPFRSIDALDDTRSARLFSVLARGAPEAAMLTLNRIFAEAARDRLLKFGSGRRDTVWTLERLLERRGTFFEAARLIRKLAEAENESITNNATGIWTAIFLTFLAPTEVPAKDRQDLIEEALNSAVVEIRLLAIEGLSAALRGSEMGLPIGESAGVPRQRWRPLTWGEVWEYKRAALRFLERALNDPCRDVRTRARTAFHSNARSLVHQGMADDVVRWFPLLDGEDDAERREIWESIVDVVKYAAIHLNPEQKARLGQEANRLYGDSLIDRIKRYAGRFSHVDWPLEEETDEAAYPSRLPGKLAELAEEAFLSQENVGPVLPWLVSGQAENVWPFAERLGELDAEHRWLRPLFETAVEGQDRRLLSGYLAGQAKAGRGEWRESLLDQWAGEERLAPLVFDATWRGPASDRGAARLATLVDQGWLEPGVLGWLTWGAWTRSISEDSLVELLARLARDGSPNAIETALGMVCHWLDGSGRAPSGRAEDSLWHLLGLPAGWGRGAMLSLYWRRVAERLVNEDPVRMSRLTIRMHTEGEPSLHDERLRLLSRALALAPREVWSEIGTALLTAPGSYDLVWALREARLLLQAPASVISDWIRTSGSKAARLVAESVKPEGETLPELVRFLLKEYGHDVGGPLAGNFVSGMWWGSEATYLKEKAAVARRWQEDGEPPVRRWATELVRSLERRAEEVRQREQEEELH